MSAATREADELHLTWMQWREAGHSASAIAKAFNTTKGTVCGALHRIDVGWREHEAKIKMGEWA